jgi:hypothetical protein
MDDKETLIRVEQQLQDSIKNQTSILTDLNEIFDKIESEAKNNTLVQASLRTHIQVETIIQKEFDRRISSIEQKQNEHVEANKAEITELQLFSKGLTTSLSFLKWAAGAIILVVTAIWPIIVFFMAGK